MLQARNWHNDVNSLRSQLLIHVYSVGILLKWHMHYVSGFWEELNTGDLWWVFWDSQRLVSTEEGGLPYQLGYRNCSKISQSFKLSFLILQSLLVTVCTNMFNTNFSAFCHSACLCFLYHPYNKQLFFLHATSFCSLYSKAVCSLWCTSWIFVYGADWCYSWKELNNIYRSVMHLRF